MEIVITAFDSAPYFIWGGILAALVFLGGIVLSIRSPLPMGPITIGAVFGVILFGATIVVGELIGNGQAAAQRDDFLATIGEEFDATATGDNGLMALFLRVDEAKPTESFGLTLERDGTTETVSVVASRDGQAGNSYSFSLYLLETDSLQPLDSYQPFGTDR